jgi:hypothetical protein
MFVVLSSIIGDNTQAHHANVNGRGIENPVIEDNT